jgi:hypothetical protein
MLGVRDLSAYQQDWLALHGDAHNSYLGATVRHHMSHQIMWRISGPLRSYKDEGDTSNLLDEHHCFLCDRCLRHSTPSALGANTI